MSPQEQIELLHREVAHYSHRTAIAEDRCKQLEKENKVLRAVNVVLEEGLKDLQIKVSESTKLLHSPNPNNT
jgi:hypothetical protein